MRRRPERATGTVTAETAVVLPLLVLVATVAAWTLALLGARLACVEAARAGARAAARGDDVAAVRRQVTAAGGGARLDRVARSGDGRVTVTVSARLPGPRWLGRLLPGGWHVRAGATAQLESGVPP